MYLDQQYVYIHILILFSHQFSEILCQKIDQNVYIHILFKISRYVHVDICICVYMLLN